MNSITPRGFKDVLPVEARIREELRRSISSRLDLWGYDPIETPTLEVLDVLQRGSRIDDPPFRLFDADNNLLVLRPDVTLGVARLTASRLSADDMRHRFRYDLRVFRDTDPSLASSREFTQIGVEQIGFEGADADAETVVALVESLIDAGLTGFKVQFCDVRPLKGLLGSCGVGEEDRREIMSAYHSSNLVRLDSVLGRLDLPPEAKRGLAELIRVHGGREAIAFCRDLLGPSIGEEATGALDSLDAVYSTVEDCGYGGFVGVDFSLMASFDYYTGIIMRAYAPGFGKPLGSGGRYDGLLGAFGKPAPAAGWAFSLERVMHALAIQGRLRGEADPARDVGMSGSAAFVEAMRLHGEGVRATIGGGKR